MATVEFHKNTPKHGEYTIFLFPIIALDKTDLENMLSYDLMIGFLFWTMEISWECKKQDDPII